MILLVSGCSYSPPVVHPSDWKTTNKLGTWYISYRFYDPSFRGTSRWGLKVMLKGMNRIKDLSTRRRATADLLKNEINSLHAGYNPVTRMAPAGRGAISQTTPLVDALLWAGAQIPVEGNTRRDFRSVLRHADPAIKNLGLNIAIGEVKRSHVRAILDRIGEAKGETWTANNFNHHRKYLGILFGWLVEKDVLESNPVTNIKKAKATRRVPEVLTEDQRRRVDEYLAKNDPPFQRFLHIFYHSGSRETELLRVRTRDVDLKSQWFRRLVKKGREFREVITTIQDVALPYWTDALAGCSPEDYVFSRGLLPGKVAINRERISRKWLPVKKALEIKANFNHLRHAKASEMVEEMGDQMAASHMAHTSTAMVRQIYDTKRPAREHEIKKRSGKPF